MRFLLRTPCHSGQRKSQSIRNGAEGVWQGLPQHPKSKGGHQVCRGIGPVLLSVEENRKTRRFRKLIQNRKEKIYASSRYYRLHGEVHGRAGGGEGQIRQSKLSLFDLRRC